MTKEEYLKKLILQRWTLKDFAAKQRSICHMELYIPF